MFEREDEEDSSLVVEKHIRRKRRAPAARQVDTPATIIEEKAQQPDSITNGYLTELHAQERRIKN